MTTSYILSSMPNFIRIPYSIYEIFNSFKLLSQISVTDMTYFLADVICDFFTFQQGSAPAHRARETLALYCQLKHPTSVHHPHWIGHQTLNSPDLNPVDYAIWSILQERVYRCQIRDVNHMKERLIKEWRRFDRNIIDRAVNQWRDRLYTLNV